METIAEVSKPVGKTVGANGFLRVATPAEVDAEVNRIENERTRQATPEISSLASFIETCWTENRDFRNTERISDEMLQSLRQRDGQYDPEKLSSIQDLGGSDIFINLTGVKCRAAEAWLTDVLSSAGKKPWRLAPTPMPDLPEDVDAAIVDRAMAEWQMMAESGQPPPDPQQVFAIASGLRDRIEDMIQGEAEQRANRMEKRIEDVMVEGSWDQAFDDFIADLVTLKAGMLKGPVPRVRKNLEWVRGFNGRTTYRMVDKIVFEVEAVSPFNCFPSPGATTPDEGNFIELMNLSRKDLSDKKKIPGYFADSIDLVLNDHAEGLLDRWTGIEEELASVMRTGGRHLQSKAGIQAIDFWGSCRGEMLKRRGIMKDPDGNDVEDTVEYEINAILVGRYIIYATFNDDPYSRRPYFKTSWARMPGSFWGKGVPDLMRDLQNLCNASVRSMVNNLGWSSGPQVSITDVMRIPPGESITKMYPGKIWQFSNSMASPVDPIKFFQPSSNSNELMAVYDKFSQLADDFTGIPAYAYGNDRVAGAGRTASGLEMLMSSAARGIKKVISNIDKRIMRPVITRYYEWLMLFDDDESIKGDINIAPIGVLSLIVQEQMASRRMEFLQATANPIDSQIIDLPRRANVLRETAKALDLDSDDVVPSKEDMVEIGKRMQAILAQQAAAGGVQEQAAA